jgi:hypothetical protein
LRIISVTRNYFDLIMPRMLLDSLGMAHQNSDLNALLEQKWNESATNVASSAGNQASLSHT